jgi:hypothetical protein
MTDGPCFISDDAVENLQSHMGDTAAWELESAVGASRGPWRHSDATSYISLASIHVEYTKRRLNGSTAHGQVDRQAAPFETIPSLPLPKTGPVWLTGQGTRGHYLTLPSPKPADWKPTGADSG